MNILEIMKISSDVKILDGLYVVKDLLPESPSKQNKLGIIIGIVMGFVVAVGLMVLKYCCFMAHRSKTSLHIVTHGYHCPCMETHTISKVLTTSRKSRTASCISLASTNLGHVFMFQEIMDAMNKFDESLFLGLGGFRKVYKGMLENGTKVAVKRGNPRFEQGLAEFHTEIEMLSKLWHHHLVSLIGYCDECSEMIWSTSTWQMGSKEKRTKRSW